MMDGTMILFRLPRFSGRWFELFDLTHRNKRVDMMSILTIVAPNQYNGGHRTHRNHLTMDDIDDITAVHRDTNWSQSNPVIEYFAIHSSLLFYRFIDK